MSALLKRQSWIAGAFLLLVAGAEPCAQPSRPDDHFLPDSLVELITIDSTIHLDIRYATPRNFMGRPMYTQARAFLQFPAAAALVRVSGKAHGHGYGLLVFDAYRPWSVTKKFWDETPREKRMYVANPRKGSRHNRGCAVDLSLYDLATGAEVIMPSPYDDFSKRAAARYTGGTASQRASRDLLRELMTSEGFSVNPDEWWHFDFKVWHSFRVLDIPFEKLP
jgi:D-alanyl-D-alanine dipeptidase